MRTRHALVLLPLLALAAGCAESPTNPSAPQASPATIEATGGNNHGSTGAGPESANDAQAKAEVGTTSGDASSSPSGEASSSPSATASSSAMEHSGHQASALPTGIPTAASPKFAVGAPVTITAGHMPGMKGAKGTVAAAYDTTTYAVDYQPTTGGAVVKGHKWVVAQEVTGAKTPAAVGDKVTITADHMPGMKGAKGTVSQVVKTPVYAVNYTPTDGSPMVMNHLWVTQDELTAR